MSKSHPTVRPSALWSLSQSSPCPAQWRCLHIHRVSRYKLPSTTFGIWCFFPIGKIQYQFLSFSNQLPAHLSQKIGKPKMWKCGRCATCLVERSIIQQFGFIHTLFLSLGIVIKGTTTGRVSRNLQAHWPERSVINAMVAPHSPTTLVRQTNVRAGGLGESGLLLPFFWK